MKEDPLGTDMERCRKGGEEALRHACEKHFAARLRMSETLNLTTSCSRGLIKFLTGIKQLKNWAFQMVDSSALVPHGILRGSISSFG
ncbi:hypothetical protein CEXT_388731 [Caerostris extrusa]|uniref:Nose resistant-to-fluoxetine protein N-terminal domain-containing protein n=1 Tax=Caerostris extrusa TaxID=172846 RepID=A0AAV4P432_CAEEX|nr:hypothetical protein CEXT_388731 [Caerostris extrusa]